VTGTVQLEHEPAADHVLESPVRLDPVPGLAKKLREPTPGSLRVAADQIPDEGRIGFRYFPSAILEHDFHGT